VTKAVKGNTLTLPSLEGAKPVTIPHPKPVYTITPAGRMALISAQTRQAMEGVELPRLVDFGLRGDATDHSVKFLDRS
jgi:hypothetical protein